MSSRIWAAAAVIFSAAALPVHAQDTTGQRGVRIGLTYAPGTKPGVVVLPVDGPGGDSVQAIIARDLDFGDRIEVIDGSGVTPTSSAGGSVSYGIWKSMGAAALVQVTLLPSLARVAVHDVAAKKIAQSRDFPIATDVRSAGWRMDVHGISDEIERWITGVRGVASTRILYVRGGRVYVVDSDGFGEHAVTSSGTAMAPTWHPDGHHIAYSQLGTRGWNIEVVDLAGGGRRPVTATSGGLNTTPAYSPDGQWLVYAHGAENGTDLYAVQAFTGGAARRITLGRGTDNVSPTFSPDGRRLAFTSGRSGHPEVYTADFDGSNMELLTPFNFGDQNYRSNPDWSPDGRSIVFQSQLDGLFQIMTINLRDRSIKQLTSEGANEDPSWAPDGRHVVFTSTRTGVKQLFVLDTESGRSRQLTHSSGSRLSAWSRYLDRAP
jgi:TolB protein